MTIAETPSDVRAIADEAMFVLGKRRQIAPFSSRRPAFGMDEAYRVTAAVRRMREAGGEKVLGRKIGFTNRTIWAQYGVYAPIWGYVYDSTVHDLAKIAGEFSLANLAEPRIEPEIVFGMAAAPEAGMDEQELLGCIAWVAHGFEIVQSVFPDWKFAAADTVAAFGLHGALLVGERHSVSDSNRAEWLRTLSSFDIALHCNGEVVDRGHAGNVLDGPLTALRHLVELLAHEDAVNPAVGAGEIVTTGTLTQAMLVKSGDHWATTLSGISLGGIDIRFG